MLQCFSVVFEEPVEDFFEERAAGVEGLLLSLDHLQLRGAVTVDEGAVGKLRADGKSLLPIGMTSVDGDFSRGDVIAVREEGGAEIARVFDGGRPASRIRR